MKWHLVFVLFIPVHFIFSQESHTFRMKDCIGSSISKSDILYLDIDNYLDVELPDSLNLHFSTYNGFLDTDSVLNLIPQRAGICRLKVYSVNNGDSALLGIRSFKVEPIPLPSMYLDTVKLLESIAFPKSFIQEGKSFRVHVSDDIIGSDMWFRVSGYTIILNQRGRYLSKTFNGAVINGEARKLLCRNRYPTKFILHFKVKASSEIIIQHRLEYFVTIF